MGRCTHWCHNGCGKCVIYTGHWLGLNRYKCERCGLEYADKEALDWKNKKKKI